MTFIIGRIRVSSWLALRTPEGETYSLPPLLILLHGKWDSQPKCYSTGVGTLWVVSYLKCVHLLERFWLFYSDYRPFGARCGPGRGGSGKTSPADLLSSVRPSCLSRVCLWGPLSLTLTG